MNALRPRVTKLKSVKQTPLHKDSALKAKMLETYFKERELSNEDEKKW